MVWLVVMLGIWVLGWYTGGLLGCYRGKVAWCYTGGGEVWVYVLSGGRGDTMVLAILAAYRGGILVWYALGLWRAL